MVLIASFARTGVGATTTSAAAALEDFDTPAPSLVRETTREILADPHFSPHKTFWQWLSEKLNAWKGPSVDFSGPWFTVLGYFIVVWCILALLAVLGHIVWVTITFLLNRAGSRRGTHLLRVPFGGGSLSYEELDAMMRRFAEQGAFRDAVSAMMAALLRWLDLTDVLRLHQSKTNGDYVREFPAELPARDEFRRFVLDFERTVYGGAPCDRLAYQELSGVFEQIRGHVQPKP
ncbi:MAG: DUF4129 domain-containing protein [Phycisphaerae bacterium]|nr:DUF4129 domain-containing protein [Phycisphaerae bacterium]